MKVWLKFLVLCTVMSCGGYPARASPGEETPGTAGARAESLTAEVEQKVLLEGIEPVLGIPGEMLIEYDGKKEYYPVKSAKLLRERWNQDLELRVLFYVYDADYYDLGEVRVPRRGDGPGLEGYEGTLLKALGLKAVDYVIENVVWDGEAYYNDEGIQCRNALARGRKRVEDYEVVYGRDVVSEVEINCGGPFTPQTMEEAPGSVISIINSSGSENLLRKVLRMFIIITMAIWILMLLLALLFLIVVQFKKQMKTWHGKKHNTQ